MDLRISRKDKIRRVLLIEANDMPKWVGSGVSYGVHIPPIGLMYLAAYVRKMNPGLEIRIAESSLHFRTDEDYIGILDEFRPDVVGIRSITFFLEELQRIARLSRNHCNPYIVAGGPIVPAYREAVLSCCPEIDAAVKGEGEEVFSAILEGRKPETIRGLFYRTEDKVIENPEAPLIPDCDTIPFPAYDLIDIGLYQKQLSYAYNHRRQGILVTSRGCPYNCTFCFKYSSKIRLRSAENVYEEIRLLYKDHGISDFYIVDDLFNVSPKRALSIFQKIIHDGLDIRLYFSNGLRADIATRDFVDRAVEAGAIWFTYAIESANPEIQKLINKNVDLNKARDIIEYTQSKGVVVNISTMYGFPTENKEMARQTLNWLGALKKPSLLPYHFCLRCFPGCKIRTQALQAGWNPELLELSSRFSYNDLPLGTPSLPKSEMYAILFEYHKRFGLRNPGAVKAAVGTLESVGYSKEEILHMYSVLKNKTIRNIHEIYAS
jgi:anaerobic magnesium-protoporphyrin IX monomethyl ester cyclase